MDSFVKFTSLSQGRERIFRTIQYACMLLNYLIHKNDSNKELVSKLKQLESNMSSGRKSTCSHLAQNLPNNLWRVFKMVEDAPAQPTLLVPLCHTFHHSHHCSDPYKIQYSDWATQWMQFRQPEETYTFQTQFFDFALPSFLSSRAVYFICDNVLWMGAVGLGGIDKEKWNKRCNHYYFFSLVISLSRDVYEITLLLREEALAQKGHQGKSINPLNANHVQRDFGWALTISSEDFFMLLYQSLKNNPPVLLDLIKNLCDLSLPLDKLGIFRINPGVVSLCGLISSVVSILTLTHPALKLRP